jgi:hypothetical protein
VFIKAETEWLWQFICQISQCTFCCKVS